MRCSRSYKLQLQKRHVNREIRKSTEYKKWTYTDNTVDYEITGLCISQRRNQGAREPSYNPAGSAKFGDSNFWYNTTDARSNVTDCFTTVGDGSIAGANSGRAPAAGSHGGLARIFQESFHPVLACSTRVYAFVTATTWVSLSISI